MIRKAKLAKEIVVMSRNRIGTLAGVAKMLADSGMDILAISAQSAGGVALMNFIVDEHVRAKDLLKKKGVSFHENGVVLLSVEDRPGVLKELTRKLAARKVDILNLYGSAPDTYDQCTLVLATDNNQQAVLALKKSR